MKPTLKSFFYHSRLSAEFDATCVSAIIKTARTFNALHAITGLLVFDGERFCQYFEGPPEAVDELVSRLRADSRHTDFTVLISDVHPQTRLFPAWSMAYAVIDDFMYLRDLAAMAPQDALIHLHTSVERLDVN